MVRQSATVPEIRAGSNVAVNVEKLPGNERRGLGRAYTDRKDAQKWYNSDDYKPPKELRQSAGDFSAVFFFKGSVDLGESGFCPILDFDRAVSWPRDPNGTGI